MQKFGNSQMVLEFTAQMRTLKWTNSQMLLATISRKFALNIKLN